MALPVFDPRQIPVDAVDAHLSAVDHSELQADALMRRFAMPPVWSAELPGDHSAAAGKVLRRAAVLVPIVVGVESTVLLTQRTDDLSSHPGQIAFPGGRIDPQDRDEADAALREAWEEVGLERRFVTVLGNLPAYATGSAYSVTPVVALVQPGFTLRTNRGRLLRCSKCPCPISPTPPTTGGIAATGSNAAANGCPCPTWMHVLAVNRSSVLCGV